MEQGAGSSKDKGKGKLKTLDPRCWRCKAWDLVCEMLVGGKLTSCKECKAVKGHCKRLGEERVCQDWVNSGTISGTSGD